MYIYDNELFFEDLIDVIEHLGMDEDEIKNLPEDYTIEAFEAELAPIVKFDAEWITERIDEERFSEDGSDEEITKIMKILNENIDFEKINSQIPKLYYPTRKLVIFTKADILDWI